MQFCENIRKIAKYELWLFKNMHYISISMKTYLSDKEHEYIQFYSPDFCFILLVLRGRGELKYETCYDLNYKTTVRSLL